MTSQVATSADPAKPEAPQLRVGPDPCREGKSRHDGAERGARWVLAISFGTMIAEIVAGRITGSLALYADGWHMATHAGALASTVLALWFARRYRASRHFSFGTGKVHALAGWTSALVLAGVAIWMLVEAALRIEVLVSHGETPIDFLGAIVVAVIGLVVNLVSVALLGHGDAKDGHGHGHAKQDDHDHDDDHAPGHGHGHGSTRPRARSSGVESMIVHLISDALTSALAIGALLGGRFLGWSFLDPVVAAVGGVVVLRWAVQLLGRTGKELLDATPSTADEEKLRAALEAVGDARVLDLHLWDQGPGHRFAIVSLEVDGERTLSEFRKLALAAVAIDHLTIEIGRAPVLDTAGSIG